MTAQNEDPQRLLRLYQKRISSLIRSLPLGIIIVRSDGTIETANATIVSLFQYSEAELTGRNVGFLLQNSPWLEDDGGANFRSWCAQKQDVLVELEGRAKNDEIIPVDLGVRALDADNTERLVVVVQDVTDRFMANKLKQEFYQMINHDVRSPLSNLLLFLSMLEHRTEWGVLTPFGRERLASAEGNVKQILQLIDGLLELDKVESSVGNLKRELVSVKELVQASISAVDAKAQHKDVELVAMTDEDCIVHGDFNRLQQVLVNLLGNALQYTVKGKPMIVSGRAYSGVLRVSVQDNGPGVPDDEKAMVFERFKQGSKKASGGFGIGLAVCKEIVRQHGGVIGCEDAIGGGSVFWFEIPLSGSAC